MSGGSADLIVPGPNGGNPAPPAAGVAFAWDPALPATHVDLLKSKGMYDDPTKGAGMLVNSYFEANKALSGGDVIIAPGDWTNQEAVDKYLGKTRGVAKAEEYTATFDEGVTVNPELLKFSQKLAHDWGVPKALFQKGINAWTAFAKEQNVMFETAAAKANDDGINALKTKMGPEAYTAAVANAQSVYKSLAAKGAISPATLAALDKGIGSVAVVELMAAIGAAMKGEAGVLGNGNNATPTDPAQMTPEQAKASIAQLQGDAEFQKKYLDSKHPEHKVAVERMKNLFAASVAKAA